jgi:hypothetical protein
MKKILLATCFLGAQLYADNQTICEPKKIVPIKLKDPVLGFVDGTNLIDMASMVHFARLIHALQVSGRLTIIDPVTGDRYERSITLKGCPCSAVHVAQVNQQKPNDPSVQEAHKEALDIFVEISRPYLAEVKNAKEYMVRLIKVWSEMRNRPDSHMLEWGSCCDGNEEEDFYQMMSNPEKFCTFLEDLRCFLVDMMNTCEKSWKRYDDMRRGITHHNPA